MDELFLSLNESSVFTDLRDLNKKYEIVSQDPDNYFVCSNCKSIGVFNKKKFEEIDGLLETHTPIFKFSVFAGYYCEDCYKKDPKLKKTYEKSKKANFYD